MIGQTLSHFRVTAKIGEGGMGEVYRAEDTKLGREVAIKLLPAEFVSDVGRMARFEREAKILASLSHPNIAAIYELSEDEGIHFLVMELAEGESLADRLARGAIPPAEALPITLQIAAALEAAHEQGVVHRDLKPANVVVGPDGTVKVLDFGLAKATSDDHGPDRDLSHSPTLTARQTEAGVILGTAAYMSPEQARGYSVDKRTDIWALGVVLMEMLTGQRLFPGGTTSDILAGILTREPDFKTLPTSTPVFLRRLLRRCLDKDPKRRLRDVGELRFALEEHHTNPGSESLGNGLAPAPGPVSLRLIAPWILVLVLGASFIYLFTSMMMYSDRPDTQVSSWSIALAPGSRVDLPSPGGGFDYSRTVAVSPDGSRIAFSVTDDQGLTQLYLKADDPQPNRISGTVNGRGPFFSPDGEWLGFYSSDENILYKVALMGGSPQKLCELDRTVSFDGSWAPAGQEIVFATDDGLWRVSAAGGPAERLTRPDEKRGEVGHHAPRFTLDGRAILFTISKTPDTELATLDLDTGSWRTIAADVSLAVQVGEDLLVVAKDGEILTAPFDSAERVVLGPLVPALQGIQTTPGLGGITLTQFDVSTSGTVVFVPANVSTPTEQLLWVDGDGNETLIAEGPGEWVHPRLSPDGSRISLDIHASNGMRDVYVYELEREQLRQLTRTGMSWESEWSSDGDSIALLSGLPAGQWSLFSIETDFSGPPRLLFQTEHAVPGSWLPDGRSVLFTEWVNGGIWSLQLGNPQPDLVMRTEAREGFPRLSPDARWVAYVATESGHREVFVRPFPEIGPPYKISIDGGGEPVWSHDGRRLFFRQADQMFEVGVRYDPTIHFDPPRLLFRGDYDSAPVGHQHFDISLDDENFLMIKHGEGGGSTEVRVVLNRFSPAQGR